MTTTIEDNELDAELQELYLTGKQWSAELEFLSTELIFLGKLIQKTSAPLNKNIFVEKLLNLTRQCQELKDNMQNLVHAIGVITVASEKKIELTLLENHIELKSKIQALTHSIQIEKKAVFALVPRSAGESKPDS
ncbi:hypothetical protein [Pedobacter nutrimenti]|uniref:Uncharacterized protein n=1 Tax=Pedobacter nutrimenti TaxID=1241337 RepID=A0A318U9G0_9SPHI|nr:hypothetical protein [Pedobacter nutrimenti]PYF70592.1 hypothetical protein B0O44_10818 [Pedobacter nutrimenti]